MTVVPVDSIRPESLQKLKKDAENADHEWFVQHQNEFMDGVCPLCVERKVNDKKIDTGDCIYRKCGKCGTLYLDRHPTSTGYDEFYRISENMKIFSEKIFSASKNNRINFIYKPRSERLFEICRKYQIPNGAYIEIGAGSGIFAGLIKEYGYFSKVIAIEPNPYCARDCRDLGLDTIEAPVEALETFTSDAVLAASFECIEHLVDPARHVKDIYDRLPRGGMFVLTTPNARSLEVLELEGRSTTLGWTHIHLFNPYSIARLLEVAGFSILELTTPGILDVDLVRKGYAGGGADPRFLKKFYLMAATRCWQIFNNFWLIINFPVICGSWR